MSAYCIWDKGDILLSVYLCPNAKKDEIVGPFEQSLKIKIKAPAIENKANTYLLQFLANLFGVPKTQVALLKGAQSRHKKIKIIQPQHLPDWITDKP